MAEATARIVAKYDIRTKQAYIYRTNAIKEIVGGSALITSAYDRFLDACRSKLGMSIEKNYTYDGSSYLNDEEKVFSVDMDGCDGRVIYVGGGTLYMLWRDRKTAVEANRLLCRTLREDTYSLSAVCGMTEYTGKYATDIEHLNADYDKAKALTPAFLPGAVLPFTELDRKTSLPIVWKDMEKRESFSMESVLKLKKYEEVRSARERSGRPDENELDRMITKKGRESLLAVIYIDGNNMSARIRETMRPNDVPIEDYPTAVKTIRGFSNQIQAQFVSEPLAAIREYMKTQPKSGFRVIVAGGDEITIICNARAALGLVKAYFDALVKGNQARGGIPNTACAGVCVFHSHFPFSTAYAIAEECAENAKKVNRSNGGSNMLVDMQHCFGGVVGSLEDIRRMDRTDLMRRPLYIADKGDDRHGTLQGYIEAAGALSGFGRANVKELSELEVDSPNRLKMELCRLHEQFPKAGVTEEHLRYLYDTAQFYDIWFAVREEARTNG